MELLGKWSLYIHIFAGILTLIAGPIALFYESKPKLHRLAGKVFFYAMVIVIITSIAGFLKRPHLIFFQFLLGISMVVAYHLTRGVRAILIMKKKRIAGLFDQWINYLFILCGVLMTGKGIWNYLNDGHLAFTVLFTVFGLSIFPDAFRFSKLLKIKNLDPRWWLKLHLNSMFGAFIASTTAFAVNAATFAPWYIQWFAPTIILVPLQIYLLNKRKVSGKDLGNLPQSITS